MISIIVSSYKPDFFEKLSSSIKETIGVPFEIIRIENYAQYSLAEAYNLGVKQAKFNYVCFVHEDVIFLSKNWGKEVISLFNNDMNIGLIGIAGSKYKSSVAIGWIDLFTRGKLKQGINSYTEFRDDDYDHTTTQPKKEIEDVVCIDGVFMMTTRKVLLTCKFDEKILDGFHGYDIDFSLQCFFYGYRVIVDRNIYLFHCSIGLFEKDYKKYAWKISRKYFGKLPVATKDLNLGIGNLLFTEFKLWGNFIKSSIYKRLISKKL